MNVSRRDVVVAGTLALGASGLLLNGASSAEAGDEESVARSVEVLRKALLEADRSKLEQVASAQISYGHSDGRVQNKEEFARFPRAEDRRRRQCGHRAPHLPVPIRARRKGDGN